MNIAAYVRVSGQRQVQTQTIEQQLERLQIYCQCKNWFWEDVQIFRDDGYSGASLKRPGLDRLRDQVGRAIFDRVLITAPDRLARKYVHQVLLVEELERGGCQVEFVEHPMSQDPHDQLLLQIRGAVAEYERTLIAERMRRGRLQKFRAGTMLPWSRPPYGYRLDPDHPRDPSGVRLQEPEAIHVAEIFAYYLEEGHGLEQLAKHLHQLGIPTPNGKSYWSLTTLRDMLRNPVYAGTVYAGRERVVAKHRRFSPLQPIGRRSSTQETPSQEWIVVGQVPAIVSQEQFDWVQAKLADNLHFARRNNTSHQYLLRALVSCGLCHLSCLARTSSGHAYYVCRGKQGPIRSRREECCHARFIPVEQLDTLVWQDLCEVLQHPVVIEQALQRAQAGAWLPQELQARRTQVRKARNTLCGQLERLTEAYLADAFPLGEYKRRRQDVEQRLVAVEMQASQIEASVQQHMELASITGSINEFCQRMNRGLSQATFEQKRQLVELLVDRVVVTMDEVEIRYVIPTSPRNEQVRFCHLLTDYSGAE
ncbi:recombinase family protein [Ktedonobacter racemifer]|uniref:Resolvase domain protein n=1 Tax=Ktedonobacter racemifer DSM 44963 TaxID=485913 RepID=D6TSX0_KTERA|nr:recombinase family protein [Ktedonobacter racemifer]EFH83521.1 Resolvase domain protein [Ktedonobacter racemifer DSM 44963]